MEANKIQVIDDQGNEKEFEVLFTSVSYTHLTLPTNRAV